MWLCWSWAVGRGRGWAASRGVGGGQGAKTNYYHLLSIYSISDCDIYIYIYAYTYTYYRVNGAHFYNHQPNLFSCFCAKPLVRRIQLHLQYISWSCHVCSQVGWCYIVIGCIEHFAVLDKTRYSSVLSEWHQWFRPWTCVVPLDPFFWGPLCTSGRFAQHLFHACHFIHHNKVV